MRYLSNDYEGSGRLTFDPSGRWLYGLLGEGLVGWDLATDSGRPTWTVRGGIGGYHLAASWCGQWLVVVSHGGIEAFHRAAGRPPHRLWPVSTYRVVGDATFRPDGGELLAVESGHATGDGRAHSWRVGDWEELPPPPGVAYRSDLPRRLGFTGRLAVSSDGIQLATEYFTANGDEYGHGLTVWDLNTGKRLADGPIGGSTVGRLLFTADGTGLLSDQYRSLVRYDASTLAPTAQFVTPVGSHLDELAVCPDGRRIAAGMGEHVVLLDAADLRPIAAYAFRLGPMVRVAFAPNGQTAAACGGSGRVVVFDLD